jgi:arginase family enzyme
VKARHNVLVLEEVLEGVFVVGVDVVEVEDGEKTITFETRSSKKSKLFKLCQDVLLSKYVEKVIWI